MNAPTLRAFVDELQKIAEDSDDGLTFFERHPKKILGGAALAAGAGLMLLKGKKSPAGTVRITSKSPSSTPKALSVPMKAKEVKIQKPSTLDQKPKTPEWAQAAVGPEHQPIQSFRRDASKEVPQHKKGRHLELQDKAKMERKLEDEVVKVHHFSEKHAMRGSHVVA